MTIEILAPEFGESIMEATVAEWLKKPGDAVEMDEPLVALETDKATLEVPAPRAGILEEILVQDGETVQVGGLLARMKEREGAAAPAPAPAPAAPAPAVEAPAAPAPAASAPAAPSSKPPLAPAARTIAATHGLDASSLEGTGPGGRVMKSDALAATSSPRKEAPAIQEHARARAPAPPPQRQAPSLREAGEGGEEERVRMTRIRQTIARRLKDAQNTAAILTTFNEVDMTRLLALRASLKEPFLQKYGVKLGFMGFFVKACTAALEEVPEVNAQIEGDEIVYRRYANIGVAVGTDRGLVVPVLRHANRMSLEQIEKAIESYATAAHAGSLSVEQMTGGTFTISNGGVYGSLLSTPILNAPQSGVLGMHKIDPRPVAREGKIEIRPMMYLALSYDHRLVDGREAVTFLVRVKERIENPAQILLDAEDGSDVGR